MQNNLDENSIPLPKKHRNQEKFYSTMTSITMLQIKIRLMSNLVKIPSQNPENMSKSKSKSVKR